ncbi:MAG: 2-oxoglutarate synthase subunit KorA [Methanosaeta sp. PtaB.Bin018]|jgi:2-oxoglutarate ferredoxin oxidoreductase subunit alpha|nr:MAG: 2-oxoglutarate synthase subunit KorA [Methanosaeta sp. PtaB.Bin018]
MMNDFSTLIGGIAGDGINEAGGTIARLFNRLGFRIFMYYDYPSLIRGGHNFSVVRASKQNVGACKDQIDVLIALNQDTVEMHKWRLLDDSFVIYDADRVKADGIKQRSCGIPVTQILKEEGALPVMKNSCILGGFCQVVGIEWAVLKDVLLKHIPKKVEQNLRVARRGYDSAVEFCRIERASRSQDQLALPVMTGNQAICLGLIKAGLGAYVAYPMTPSSSLLDFMARLAPDFGLKVVHPENEIAVILMAQGFAYAGIKAAVGTSGGGFCLMTEGVSLAGMAENPVVIVMSQRTGPSTGLPTYTAQGDLHFVLNAGQGEFPRFVVSPGDAADAYYWSGIALNMAWKYQTPAFILSDKVTSESLYSLDLDAAGDVFEEEPLLWDGQGKYNRYSYTNTGVSPMAFPPQKGQVIKADSYVHDEFGITTEDPKIAKEMNDKRLQKGRSMAEDLDGYETVKVFGEETSKTALLCWGSNKGVCIEAARKFGLKAIQVLVLSPFPEAKLLQALEGVHRLIAVECNSTAQLARLVGFYGIKIHDRILKYDGRPFSLDDLQADLGRILG